MLSQIFFVTDNNLQMGLNKLCNKFKRASIIVDLNDGHCESFYRWNYLILLNNNF